MAGWQLWKITKMAGQGLSETQASGTRMKSCPHPRPGRADWLVPTELDLQDLCVGAAESEELDGMWNSLFVFIALFLFSVAYGASVTLFKVKWVLATVLQETPQTTHDYVNIVRPAAWASSMGSPGLAVFLPASERH